jgi:phage host-nuclease inhibitor protein Gam
MSSKKVKKPAVAPRDLDEASRWIEELGRFLRKIQGYEKQLNDQIAALRDQAIAAVEPQKDVVEALIKGLFVFGEKNRGTLTENGTRKSVRTPAGDFGWRIRPPSIEAADEEAVIAAIVDLGLGDKFTRRKVTLNREALLDDPGAACKIPGIAIVKDLEDFFIRPADTKIELTTRGRGKSRKTLIED